MGRKRHIEERERYRLAAAFIFRHSFEESQFKAEEMAQKMQLTLASFYRTLKGQRVLTFADVCVYCDQTGVTFEMFMQMVTFVKNDPVLIVSLQKLESAKKDDAKAQYRETVKLYLKRTTE